MNHFNPKQPAARNRHIIASDADVTDALLQRAYEQAAELAVMDAKYAPIFERLEMEIAKGRDKQNIMIRARRALNTGAFIENNHA